MHCKFCPLKKLMQNHAAKKKMAQIFRFLPRDNSFLKKKKRDRHILRYYSSRTRKYAFLASVAALRKKYSCYSFLVRFAKRERKKGD